MHNGAAPSNLPWQQAIRFHRTQIRPISSLVCARDLCVFALHTTALLHLVLKRILTLPLVIVSITLITFIVGYLAPGDPILTMMGSHHDPLLYASLRHQYGLDLPWYQQYLNY